MIFFTLSTFVMLLSCVASHWLHQTHHSLYIIPLYSIRFMIHNLIRSNPQGVTDVIGRYQVFNFIKPPFTQITHRSSVPFISPTVTQIQCQSNTLSLDPLFMNKEKTCLFRIIHSKGICRSFYITHFSICNTVMI